MECSTGEYICHNKKTTRIKLPSISITNIFFEFSEAHPASLNYWTREDGHMIHDNRKYRSQNEVGNHSYKTHMKLIISDVQAKDFGTYKCVAKNPRVIFMKKLTIYYGAKLNHSRQFIFKMTPTLKCICLRTIDLKRALSHIDNKLKIVN